MTETTTDVTHLEEAVAPVEVVDIAELHPHPRNARQGNVELLVQSLQEHGQYAPIIVNRGTRTGRPNEILKGHHITLAAQRLGYVQMLVRYVDLDDAQAAKLMLIDNRSTDLATYDERLLVELLDTLPDLHGSGYTDDDYAALVEMLENEHDEGELPDPTDIDEDQDLDKGSALELGGVVVGEPDFHPRTGEVWKMGPHLLVCTGVHKHWPEWSKLLREGMIFVPYPSMLAPFTTAAEEAPMLFVQPNHYLAGWLLTKWQRIKSDAPELLVDK